MDTLNEFQAGMMFLAGFLSGVGSIALAAFTGPKPKPRKNTCKCQLCVDQRASH